MLAGLVGFGVSSPLGGLATSSGVLVAARGMQGLTGAFVAATALALLSVMFPAGRLPPRGPGAGARVRTGGR